MSERRELYQSPNGDCWYLASDPTNERVSVIHQANAPSGGRLSHIELGEFLKSGKGPEQQAVLRFIGTLVEASPAAARAGALMPKISRVLETALYVADLDKAAVFYADVMASVHSFRSPDARL